jgi:hypothetical protein
MLTHLFWAIAVVGAVLVAETAWSDFKESRARRRAVLRARQVGAKLAPWR